jgi:Rrf2 family protein
MKLITRETDYAVKILISSLKKNDILTVRMLEDELDIPRPFLRKIVQQLAKAGLVRSKKGRNGGFRLKKHAEEISLIDVMRIFQGKFSMNECLFRQHICPNKANCSLRRVILGIESKVEKELKSLTLKKIIIS